MNAAVVLVFGAQIAVAVVLIWAAVSCHDTDCRRWRAARLRLRAHLRIGSAP